MRQSHRVSPQAIVARFPEQECICPVFAGIWRAHQDVIVPESLVTMAFAGSRLPNSCATTCGFIGIVMSVARVIHQFAPVFHSVLGLLKESAVLVSIE